MNKNRKHTIKSLAVISTAICISMLYLMNPLHQQISNVWHNISHAMESPSNILSHQKINNEKEIHEFHDHQLDLDTHEHEIIDFISSIFEASNTDDSPSNSLTIDNKIDKHFISEYIFLQNISLIKIHQNFTTLIKMPFQGYKDSKYIPPQLS